MESVTYQENRPGDYLKIGSLGTVKGIQNIDHRTPAMMATRLRLEWVT